MGRTTEVRVVPAGKPASGSQSPLSGVDEQSPLRALIGDAGIGLGRIGTSGRWNGAAWTVRAMCAGADPDMLFVPGAAQRDAAKVCQSCPVRLECLADALDNRIEYGVWGGMTERQRRAVLKKSPDVASWRSLLEEAKSSVREVAS